MSDHRPGATEGPSHLRVRRTRGSRRAAGGVRGSVVVALVVLLVATAIVALPPSSHSRGSSPSAPTSPLPAQSGGPSAPISYLNQSLFWGTNDRDTTTTNSSDPANYSETGTNVIRWPGGGLGDRWDYQADGGAGILYPSSPGQKNYTPGYSMADLNQFLINLSTAHDPQSLIVTLPAEINNVTQATDEVVYITQDLGLQPSYWEIGNEPARWTHFGVPWTEWWQNADRPVTPAEYALVVANYTQEILRVDPGSKFIVWPGDGNGVDDGPWIQAVLERNCGVANAVAIHVYPVGPGTPGESLPQFYASLSGNRSLLPRVPADRQVIASTCPGVPLFVDEIGSATGNNLTGLMESFADVPYIAAEIDQAMILNLTNVDFFALKGGYGGAWFGPNGTARPTFYLYTDLLRELPDIEAQNVTALTNATRGVWAVHTANASASALLVANANASSPVTVNLTALGFPTADPTEAITWNASTPRAVSTGFMPGGTLPAQWTLPGPSVAEFIVNSTGFSFADDLAHAVAGRSDARELTARPPVAPGGGSLTVKLSHSPKGIITLGDTETYTVVAKGGTPPYNFTYWGLPPGCPQDYRTDLKSIECTPDPIYGGVFLSNVTISDSLGDQNTSNNVTTPVLPTPLSVGLGCLPNCTDELGSNVYLNANGTSLPVYYGYTYSGLPPGCSDNDTPVVGCAPFAVGTYPVEVRASWPPTRPQGNATAYGNVTVVAAGPPDAPTGLGQVLANDTAVTVVWANPSSGGIENDTVWYGTSCSALTAISTQGIATSQQIDGLSNGTTYCIEVQAWSSGGGSPLSSPVFVSTLPVRPVPPPPQDLRATGATNTTIALAWLNPSTVGLVNDTVYYVAGTICSGPMTALSTNGPVQNFTLSGLSEGSAYAIEVTAWNTTGPSAPSRCLVAFTSSGSGTGLTVTSVTTNTIGLSWTNPSESVTNVTLEEWANDSCAGVPGANESLGVVDSWTVGILASASTYSFEVVDWTAAGAGPPSDCVNGTTLPNGPSHAAISDVTTTGWNVSWSNPTGSLVNDTVRLWKGGRCSGPLAGSFSAGVATQYSVGGLDAGATYAVAVQAWSAGGGGNNTMCKIDTTDAATHVSPPPAPTGLVETAVSPTSISLAWANPGTGGLVNDTVYFGTSCTDRVAVSTGGPASSYRLNGLAPLTVYCIAVQAWNGTGGSPASSSIDAQTLAPALPLLAPSSFGTVSVTRTSVLLNWVDPVGATNVTLYVGPAGCASWATSSPGLTGGTENVTGLTSGTTYCFEVRAWNATGEGPGAFVNATTSSAPVVGGPSSPAFSVWDGLALGLIVGGVIVGLLIWRVRRPPEPSAEPVAPSEPETAPAWKE